MPSEPRASGRADPSVKEPCGTEEITAPGVARAPAHTWTTPHVRLALPFRGKSGAGEGPRLLRRLPVPPGPRPRHPTARGSDCTYRRPRGRPAWRAGGLRRGQSATTAWNRQQAVECDNHSPGGPGPVRNAVHPLKPGPHCHGSWKSARPGLPNQAGFGGRAHAARVYHRHCQVPELVLRAAPLPGYPN